MTKFVTVSQIPTNPYIAGLLTEPENPNPVRWDNSAPLKVFFDDSGIRAWSQAEIQRNMAGFNEWSRVANIDFVLTTNKAEAQIISILRTTIDGKDNLLGQTTAPSGGLNPITIEYSVRGANFDNLALGGDSYHTVVHEIGHTLGIYHPHDGTLFPGVPNGADDNTGTNGQNQVIFTVMSYVSGWTGEPVTSPTFGTASSAMAFDIAAAQLLYGVRAAETGNNEYLLHTANGTGVSWRSIWDTAGSDTISANGATADATIDLRAAPLTGENAGGYVSWVKGVKGGYTIANGVTVEKAIGGSGNDRLIGNEAHNVFIGNAGNDSIDGMGGLDIAQFLTTRENVQIERGPSAIVVNANNAGLGTDTLTNVERVQFTNGILAFDTDGGSAGQVYRLYQAAFARTPDKVGLTHNLNLVDNGLGIKTMSSAFIGSAEFVNRYGQNTSDTTFINALYQNVLGRNADSAGLAGWQQRLADGSWNRADVLFGFSESGENKALVANAIKDGIWLDLVA